MDFRQDINALRALAVIGVVLFHFGVPFLSGGFVGVDVFFVISGFLMTKIIVDGLERKTFSYGRFIAARARRIIPALLVLVVVLLVAGYFFLSPKHYEWLGRDAASSVVFLSNLLFAKKVDYFSPSGEYSWLLHTWSLSVEWQFYIFFPLVVAAVVRWGGRKALSLSLIGVFTASLALCLILSYSHQMQAFYGLLPRAWMFILGGAVSLFPRQNSSRLQGHCGLILILFSYVFINEKMVYPGFLSLLPATGTALLIHAGHVSAWMRLKAVDHIGRLSYSLYLWHWPVAVFAGYAGLLSFPLIPVWVIVSLLLALISYHCVETPFRQKSSTGIRTFYAGYLLAIAIIYALSSFIMQQEGFVSRVPASLQKAYDASTSVFDRQKECLQNPKGCQVNAQQGPATAVLWGDSHADALAPAFVRALENAKLSGRIFSSSACPPISGWIVQPVTSFKGWSLKGCHDYNQGVLAQLTDDPRIRQVIIVANWAGYAANETPAYAGDLKPISDVEKSDRFVEAVKNTACALQQNGKQVFFVSPLATQAFSQPLSDLKRGFIGVDFEEAAVTIAAYSAQTKLFQKAFISAQHACGAKMIDLTPKLCGEGLCKAKINGVYVYRDQGHLTKEGALLVSDDIHAVLKAH